MNYNKLNKTLRTFLLVALSIMLLAATGCAQTTLQDGQSVTSIVPNDKISGDEISKDGENAMSLLPSSAAEATAIDKPSFLSTDLQKLYTAAHYLTTHHSLAAGFDVDTQAPTFTAADGTQMYKDNGFATYEEYTAAMRATFAQGYYDYVIAESAALYTAGDDGALYTSAGGRGANTNYVSTTFALVSETESEIEFTLISHLNGVPEGSAEGTEATTYEERTSIVVIKTDDGWRFNSFGLAY